MFSFYLFFPLPNSSGKGDPRNIKEGSFDRVNFEDSHFIANFDRIKRYRVLSWVSAWLEI